MAIFMQAAFVSILRSEMATVEIVRVVGCLHARRLAVPIPKYDYHTFNHPDSHVNRSDTDLAAQPELGLWAEWWSRHDPHNPAHLVFVARHLVSLFAPSRGAYGSTAPGSFNDWTVHKCQHL